MSIAKRLALGYSRKQIAFEFDISVRAIDLTWNRIRRKLCVDSYALLVHKLFYLNQIPNLYDPNTKQNNT